VLSDVRIPPQLPLFAVTVTDANFLLFNRFVMLSRRGP